MKRFQSIALLLSVITGALVVMLVSVFAVSAKDAYDRQSQARHLLSLVDITRDTYLAKETLRVETGAVATILVAPDAASPADIRQIVKLHAQSDAAITTLVDELERSSGRARSGLAEILKDRPLYNAEFGKIIATLPLPMERRPRDLRTQWRMMVGALSALIARQSDDLASIIGGTDAFTNELMKIDEIAWNVRVDAGTDRLILAMAVVEAHTLTIAELQQFAETAGRIESRWALLNTKARSPNVPAPLKNAIYAARAAYLTGFRAQRNDIILRLTSGQPLPDKGEDWLRNSNPSLGAITNISKTALDMVEAHAARQADHARQNFFLAIGLMGLSIGLAVFVLAYVVWRVIRPLKAIARALKTVTDGGVGHVIPFEDRPDEIGQFSRALHMFQDNLVEKRRLESELLRNLVARESAETSNRIKSEFLTNMSHELRTPLNAIIGFSDMMQHRLHGPLVEKYGDYATLINESGHHLLNLVSDILDLAKIEAGKFALDPQPIDLAEEVHYCMQMLRRRADEHGIALTADLPPAPLTFIADCRAFRQILLNLLSNAIKFTRDGGAVSVAAQAMGDTLTVTVRDNGIGIPAAALSRIGRAFEQASNDPMLAREGTGLGLALVRALVGQHGGALRIDSQEDVGTTVTVEMPLSQRGRMAA